MQLEWILNIPPFTGGHQQLPAEDVQKGRQTTSFCIHVERAIGSRKSVGILKSTLPLAMARIANQIVCVCAWLVNFQPALIPPGPPPTNESDDIEQYFESLYSTDYDADSELSDVDFD